MSSLARPYPTLPTMERYHTNPRASMLLVYHKYFSLSLFIHISWLHEAMHEGKAGHQNNFDVGGKSRRILSREKDRHLTTSTHKGSTSSPPSFTMTLLWTSNTTLRLLDTNPPTSTNNHHHDLILNIHDAPLITSLSFCEISHRCPCSARWSLVLPNNLHHSDESASSSKWQ